MRYKILKPTTPPLGARRIRTAFPIFNPIVIDGESRRFEIVRWVEEYMKNPVWSWDRDWTPIKFLEPWETQ